MCVWVNVALLAHYVSDLTYLYSLFFSKFLFRLMMGGIGISPAKLPSLVWERVPFNTIFTGDK